EAIERVLDELAAKGFIDEARVAESVLHRRAARLGGARVLHELRAKGLPEAVIADAALQLQGTELDRALAVWQRRFGVPPKDPRERARQLRFLAARGFSGEVARRALQGATDEAS
ncbi:MAG TPA: regulatory protein RecX, partial [Ottowia sp.]|nr:regulatory protein RecX [Ottowia sp.]